MNCCDDNGDCNQGRNCPVRETRRVRAGKAPDVELWVRPPMGMTQEEMDALERQDRSDMRSAMFLAACVVVVILMMLVTAMVIA
jgi:hypothetical protein